MTIKTLAIRTMAMLTFTLTLGACSENENEMPDATPKGEKITFTASLTGAETRLEHSNPTDASVTVKWTELDQLKLFAMDNTPSLATFTVKENSISSDGKSATFEATAEVGTDSYLLFGPGDKIPDNDQGVNFRFSWLGQKQTANNSLTHLAAYNLIAAAVSGGNMTNVSFMHMTALFQFNLTGLPTGRYTNFVIKSSVSDGILSAWRMSGYTEYVQEFPLELDDIALSDGQPLTLWMMMPASDSRMLFEEGTLTLEVTDEGGNTYTNVTPISIPEGGLSYTGGKRYSMTTAMEAQQASNPLVEFLAWVQNDGWRTEDFTLTGDIDLTGVAWTPIGSSLAANRFTKTFDGGGYTISGLNVNLSTTSNVGLFGYIGSGGIVRNVTVKGSVSGKEVIGGITGTNRGTISGCTFQGTVTTSDPYVGGIAGSNYGLVVGCRVTQSTIKGSSGNIGGIAGGNDEGGSNIACLVNNVTLEGYNAGGIVGEQYDGSIVACVTSLARITIPPSPPGSSANGGIAASNYGVTINTCYWQTGTGYSKGLGADGDSQQSNCISFVSGSFPSDAVGKLNTAITAWNGTNGNKCPFQWEAGSTIPMLSPKK